MDDISEKIKVIEQELDKEQKWRLENNEKLVKRLSEEISTFHEILAEERKR